MLNRAILAKWDLIDVKFDSVPVNYTLQSLLFIFPVSFFVSGLFV